MNTLAHDVIGDPVAPRVAIFAHGILGSRNNWKSFAKKLCERVSDVRCVLVDLRGHGDSHGFTAPHTVQACADDLIATCAALALAPHVVVGHSFGGKVMLAFAARTDAAVTAQLAQAWVLDAPLGPRTFEGEEIGRVLDAIRSVPLPIPSRNDLVATLRARGLSEALAQWMTTNLRAAAPTEEGRASRPPDAPTDAPSLEGRASRPPDAPTDAPSLEGRASRPPDAFTWKFDLDVVEPLLASFGALDMWPVIEGAQLAGAGTPAPHTRTTTRVHVVRGAQSDRWSDVEKLRLTRATAHGTLVEHVLPDAGHWVHTDNPEGLLSMLVDALAR